MRRTPILALLAGLLAEPAAAQIDARMFTQPDVSETQVVFVYANDLWIAPKSGGVANRLSSPLGGEAFPRFSPDGSRIAFSASYDGNVDVYVMPGGGGTPVRVTHHPMPDDVVDWAPDGATIMFTSSRESGKQRWNQFYRVSPDGGLPQKMPMEQAEFGALAADGHTLAFQFKARDFRTWKRYRGGTAPDIYLFDLETHASENITNSPANDAHPMWHGDRLYFLSDRGANERANIWVREPSGDVRQVTDLDDFDVAFPAIGPSDIVFVAGGALYLLDLATEATREIPIEVYTDEATLKPRLEDVSSLIFNGGISATGQRAVFEARGDIFTVPAEHGPVRNLTQTSGVAERDPSWSPDGRTVAYWSDASGEYELYVRPSDGSGTARKVTSLGAGFRYTPIWSPDSERVAFIDQVGQIRIVDVSTGRATEVEQTVQWLNHGGIRSVSLSWSPDSRWLAYDLPTATGQRAIRIFDSESGTARQVTSGYYSDRSPVFGADGDYLFLLTNRDFAPLYSDVQGTWVYPNTTQLAAISLRSDVPSPLAPRSDDEDQVEKAEGDAAGGSSAVEAQDAAVEIELDGFERRLTILPVDVASARQLAAAPGKVIYLRLPRDGTAPDTPSELAYWDLEAREEKVVLSNVGSFDLSADGKKLLVSQRGRRGIIPVAPGQSIDPPLRTGELRAMVDPRAEWRQIFMDVWRLERDYFYDPGMHGVDWAAIRDQYLPLVEHAVTREDVNFIVGEVIAELNASHTYRGGGDVEESPERGVGLLGVDWALENGAYRIARIVRGAPWDNEIRSSLDHPGLDVSDGDYVLAVNGIRLDPSRDPWAAFEGLAGETVTLTVADDAGGTNEREVLVETLSDETRLRNLEWIEHNRAMVEELSGGRIGYVYVPDTGTGGQTELVRQFADQFDREALIVDERFNNGGQIPDRFIELLNRPALSHWASRNGPPRTFPVVSHQGPKVMLINGWSGSGGDAFPFYFRQAGLGPLIGTRTWGGLIGYSGNPLPVDGGRLTVPTFRMFGTDGTWFAEGHGVDPDIVVPEDPTALAEGRDPQIERAVQELLGALQRSPVVAPEAPAPEDRSRRGGGR